MPPALTPDFYQSIAACVLLEVGPPTNVGSLSQYRLLVDGALDIVSCDVCR